VGIVPLAGMAKVLEDAARNGETDVLKSMTPIFLERWRQYEEKLSMFLEKENDEERQDAAECVDEIVKILESMEAAAEEMDIDAIDDLWKQLGKYKCSEEKQEALQALEAAVLNFDVDFLESCSTIFS